MLTLLLFLIQESELDKQPDSPTLEEPSTPRVLSINQNPKYQLFLSNELRTNGVSSNREAEAPVVSAPMAENGPKMSRWDNTRLGPNHYKGSLESLTSRDWDTTSDRVRWVIVCFHRGHV